MKQQDSGHLQGEVPEWTEGDRDDKERDNVDPNNLIEGGTRNTTVRQV